MVKEIIDEEVDNSTHTAYEEYERWQFVGDLDIGDKIEIKIEPQDGSGEIKKEFVAKYINCHFNCQWQDKGVKKFPED